MQERINSFIVRTSKIDKDELERMMLKSDELLNDMGTMLIGEQAVECGLIDKVGGIKEAFSLILNELIKEKEEGKIKYENNEKKFHIGVSFLFEMCLKYL